MKDLIGLPSIAAATVAVMCGSSALNAAILTTVPMQGGMVMPVVSFHAADGRMHVAMPSEHPQLTPLLVSHPGDGFDPADPWFDALDPSRQGASFSRRYGFVMDAMSDPLPLGTQMWIRKLSGPDALKLYRYSASAPKAFESIFGADGVTNASYWNGIMFHPAVAAPPGTNGYTATFEVYLLDIATGEEVAGSASGPLVFNWTNVPDGRPALSVRENRIVWPAETGPEWVLEWASSCHGGTWSAVTNTLMIDGEPCVLLDPGVPQRFFRMKYAP
jgi:hypothetical protein